MNDLLHAVGRLFIIIILLCFLTQSIPPAFILRGTGSVRTCSVALYPPKFSPCHLCLSDGPFALSQLSYHSQSQNQHVTPKSPPTSSLSSTHPPLPCSNVLANKHATHPIYHLHTLPKFSIQLLGYADTRYAVVGHVLHAALPLIRNKGSEFIWL
ncbi:hypothetical protein BC830DRAFT_1132285 [Chytriomyces sp. MP71]|nr:hypothetical protein BC830DRAFT_1132285 [Chytriomyces sp. MP71]